MRAVVKPAASSGKCKRAKPLSVKRAKPTLCEAYSRLTDMVKQTVINAKISDQTLAKHTTKAKKVSNKTVPLKKSRAIKTKKSVIRKKVDKVSLDKCENLVTVLKDDEVTLAFGKGIGTRRKSGSRGEGPESRNTKRKKCPPVNSKQRGRDKVTKQPSKPSKAVKTTPAAAISSNTKPARKTVKPVKRAAKPVAPGNKPKKINSHTKCKKSTRKEPLRKPSKLVASKVKKEKKLVLSETDGSNSDEMPLDALIKNQSRKAKRSPTVAVQIKQEIQAPMFDDVSKERVSKLTPRTKPVIKVEKSVEISVPVKDSTTDSEDDVELQRLLAKKFPKTNSNRSSSLAKKTDTKDTIRGDSDSRTRRLRLFGFWSGPKRHRLASLNALAKVHCLYENESKLIADSDKPITRLDESQKKKMKSSLSRADEPMESVVINDRTLRGAPATRGGIGRHWEMADSSTSSEDSHSDSERQQRQQAKVPPKRRRYAELGTTMDLKDMVVRKRMASLNASAILAASYSFEKRAVRKGSSEVSTEDGAEDSPCDKPGSAPIEQPKQNDGIKPRKQFWKNKVENLKSVSDKRNSPSPILADFGIEKNICDKVMEKEKRDEIRDCPRSVAKKSSSVGEKSKRNRGEGDDVKQINIEKIGSADEYEYKSDSDSGQRKLIELRNAGGSNKKVAVIVNQDTDVTITGVYVNSTRSTHHEGYCSFAGMQYRISSTSHTQTEATAVLHTSTASDQPTPPVPAQPAPHAQQTYTPLSALSSMHHHCGLSSPQGPPQGPVSPLGRRHGCSSAFSAPPCSSHGPEEGRTPPPRRAHDGYYQPAGPLIQHPSGKGHASQESSAVPPTTPVAAAGPEHSRPVNYSPYQAPYYPHAGLYPPPPQATSYHQHYHHHQDLCYPPGYPPGSYPPPPSPYRRYLAPPPSASYHPPDLSYSSSASQAPPDPQPMVPPAPPAPSGYCSPYHSYAHPPSGPSRSLPFMDSTYQSCPCPIQACPKNVHTGPLTGTCKRPGVVPLPPVALALPQEPPGAAAPPSPALAMPASSWPDTSPGLPSGLPSAPTGLLAIRSPQQPSPGKRKEHREGVFPKKRLKRSNENAGVDRRPPRKADPTVLRDRNTDAVPEVVHTVLKCPVDTVSEVIEDVVRSCAAAAAAARSSPPPILERVPEAQQVRRRRKVSPAPPTLQPAVEAIPHLDCHPKIKKKKCSQTEAPAQRKQRKASGAHLPARIPGAPRWSNGWIWHGQPFDANVYLTNDDPPVVRRCYPAMRHSRAGDLVQPRDCILLKAGPRKTDLPFVAKVSALWENPEDGEMMVSLLWYYRPEHTEQDRRPSDHCDEIFASRHKDVNSVACIEDKCYVLTFNEYCRYRKRVRGVESGSSELSVVPRLDHQPWLQRQPPGIVAPDIVFFCRKVYDFRQKRLLKNPT